MSYFSNMDGLDLFAAPFSSAQVSRAAAAARPQQQKTAAALPAGAWAPENRTQQPDAPAKPVPKEKTPAMQAGQGDAQAPEQKTQAGEQTPAKAQAKLPEKELALDISDRTIPAGGPLDTPEDAGRKAHEKAEAERKAEWESRQLAKKQAEEEAVQKLQSMSDADIISASTERVRKDVERLTRRNMKECVSEHIQSACCENPAFARRTMHPKKSMAHCFQYINRKAREYIRQEMEDSGIKPENGIYGGDVPDGLCYQWAENYFNDMDAQEDKEREEKFTPRPYVSTASNSKQTQKKQTQKKQTPKKQTLKKQEPESGYQQMSLPGVR